MFTYKFIVRAERSNALMIRITNNRRSLEIGMGVKMSAETLSNALSTKPRPENMKWRSILSMYQTKLDDVKCDLIRNGSADIDVRKIKEIILRDCMGREGMNKDAETAKAGCFVSHFQKFIDSKTNDGTKGVYRHTLDRMRLFDPDVDTKSFEDINLAWLTNFEAFCAKTASKNARNIHLRNIRAVFNNAIDFELTNVYPFRRFKIRPEATPKRSLSVEELRKLFEYPVENYITYYLDMFKLIFMLIGINCVDLHRLTKVTRSGRVDFKRAKTGRLYSIKVEPEAMEIIKKYKGENGLLSIADRWSDHRNFRHQLNKALQRIGLVERKGRGGKKIIETAFPGLSSYWARHTWATIAADLDIPDAVISQALGHAASNSTTEIYIKRNERKVDEANRKVLDYVLYDKR